MATVKENESISIMKFNNIENVDIQIRDGDDNEIVLMDKDVRFLFFTLAEWLVEK